METMELKEYGKILKKRWWLIAGTVLLVCTITALFSFLYVQPVYQAATKLIVNKSGLNVSGIEQPSISEINANIMLINTYKEIIHSTAVMEQVAERYPELGMTAEQLIRSVNVSSVNGSQVMTISAVSPTYEKAMQLVNGVAQVFQESIPAIMQVDNVTILDMAKPQDNPPPIGANSSLHIVIGFIVALMLSIGASFLLEYLDDTMKHEGDVAKHLALLTLAEIHTIAKKDVQARNTKRLAGRVKEAPYATLNQ